MELPDGRRMLYAITQEGTGTLKRGDAGLVLSLNVNVRVGIVGRMGRETRVYPLLFTTETAGFVGNVLLKFYESVAQFIVGLVEAERDGKDTDGLDLDRAFRVLDYAETGGAPLLGVGGVPVICHGESTPKAIRNALKLAVRAVRSDMVRHSAQEVAPTLGQPSREAS